MEEESSADGTVLGNLDLLTKSKHFPNMYSLNVQYDMI